MLGSMQKNGHFMHHSVNWPWRFGERFGCVYDHLKVCVLCVTVHILGLILVTCPRTLIYVCKCIKEDQRVRKKFFLVVTSTEESESGAGGVNRDFHFLLNSS